MYDMYVKPKIESEALSVHMDMRTCPICGMQYFVMILDDGKELQVSLCLCDLSVT